MRQGWYRGAFRRLRKAWGGRCIECGKTRRLEFAHLPGKPTGIEGRGRGQPQRYHDILRYPECYVLLCEGCHKALDGRTWSYRDPPQEPPQGL